jgi:hypothetical protein
MVLSRANKGEADSSRNRTALARDAIRDIVTVEQIAGQQIPAIPTPDMFE